MVELAILVLAFYAMVVLALLTVVVVGLVVGLGWLLFGDDPPGRRDPQEPRSAT